LCVVDFEPRDLDFAKRDALRRLAHQAVTQLELRRSMALLQAAQAELTAEKAMAERLLLNVLPAAVAREPSGEQCGRTTLLPVGQHPVHRLSRVHQTGGGHDAAAAY
jgi:hypothetical protein